MADILHEDQGLERTDNPDEADVILFNTCSVRGKAQEKVFSDLGRVQHLKQNNPDLIIGVGGCVASQEGEAIVRRTPRSEEHTSELQSLMRISYAVFCLKQKKRQKNKMYTHHTQYLSKIVRKTHV